MRKRTHLMAGAVFSLACSCSAPATALVCIGSLLPDIDTASSSLGKKFKFIGAFFEHRGFTHSLLFFLLTSMINPYLGIGVLSHIILDMFNPVGVELLCPFGRKFGFPIVNKWFVTGSKSEDVFRVLLEIIMAVFILFFLINTHDGYKATLLLNWQQCKSNINEIYVFFKNIYLNIKMFILRGGF